MSTPQGERMKKAYRLTSRERRAWLTKLLDAVEVKEKAEEALLATMVAANDDGISYESIAGPLGIHASSVRERIIRTRAAKDGS